MRYEIDPVTTAGAVSRSKVDVLLSAGDIAAALAEARANPHPWYRCQSLTSVAAQIKNNAVAILYEALAAAHRQEEPNRIVSVAAWPISVLVGRGLADVTPDVERLLEIIRPEPNPVRRADALLLLLEAVISDGILRHMVLPPLLEACAATRGWKGRRILQYAALALAGVNGKAAQHVASLIPESRESRRTQKMLKRREWIGPHNFVPYYQKS